MDNRTKPLQPTVTLTEDQVQFFSKNGYLSIDQVTSQDEVAGLRDTYDRLFEQKAGREKGFHFDMVGTDEDDLPASLPQIMNVAEFAPELAQTQFRVNAQAMARQLLGPEAAFSFDHAILKPPRQGGATPWHQDEAFRDSKFTYHEVSIWMPLQESTPENGCMQFIPKSHLGEVLTHRSPNNDPRIHGLECDGDFDRAAAVSCPLPPGGATFHHNRTLHHAGPNHSDIARRAYILVFAVPPKPSSQERDFYWNAEKKAKHYERYRSWENRGGLIGKASRKIVKMFQR
jgi:hypothetical protein